MDENGDIPAAGQNLQEFKSYLRNTKEGSNRSLKLDWVNRGPMVSPSGSNGIGRINAVAIDPINANIVYAGSAGGGLWKSTNDGLTWSVVTDNIGVLGISKIVIHPTEPETIYIATGDGDGSDNYSIGVLKSMNGGLTWNTTGLNWTQSNTRLIRGLIIDPQNPNVLVVASSAGIYRSLNSGETWTLESSGNFYDLEAVSVSPGLTQYYAATNTVVFSSSDFGDTWAAVQTMTGARRIALATSKNNPNFIYAVASRTVGSVAPLLGVYKSSDFGATWQTTIGTTPNILGRSLAGTDSEGQGWYDLCIAVHPDNPNIVHVGGIITWKSIDGGLTWLPKATSWHVDKHALEYDQAYNLWEGNDGGLIKSTNMGESFSDRSNGLVISQMYKVGVSQTDRKLISGYQDNGTKVQSNTGVWISEIGGDGMQCYISPTNSSILFGSTQYGNLYRSMDNGSAWKNIKSNIPWKSEGAWVTPHMQDNQNANRIYAGYKGVWVSDNLGDSWRMLSDSFANTNLTILEVSPSNDKMLYASTSSVLRRTKDKGISWSIISNPGSNMSSLLIHPNNPEIIYITRSNYTAGAKVYQSTNGGTTWVNISGSSLPNLPANHVQYYNNGKNGLFLAMDIGLYYRDDENPQWVMVSDGLPNVEIKDIDIVHKEGKIVIATYGRGIWEASIDPSKPFCTNGGLPKIDTIDVTGNEISISWPKATGSFSGYEWSFSESAANINTPNFQESDTIKTKSLTPGVFYYFHQRTKCSSWEKTSYQTIGPFKVGNLCTKPSISLSGGNLQASEANAKYQWFECVDGRLDTIKNEVSRSFTPTKKGLYSVNVSLGPCNSTSDYFDFILSNIKEEESSHVISVYPNPTEATVTIDLKDQFAKGFQMYASDGKLVLETPSIGSIFEIDVSKLKAGTYTLFITTANNKKISTQIQKL